MNRWIDKRLRKSIQDFTREALKVLEGAGPAQSEALIVTGHRVQERLPKSAEHRAKRD